MPLALLEEYSKNDYEDSDCFLSVIMSHGLGLLGVFGTDLKDDLNNLEKVSGQYDFAIYSHVVELLECPERALRSALKFTRTIVIRFYEPPDFEEDSVELRWMDVGQSEEVPFIRRKMSKDYYRLMLSKLGCKEVHVYRDITKDQIHVLYF